jgi:uncharacterized protein (DUF2252 family)
MPSPARTSRPTLAAAIALFAWLAGPACDIATRDARGGWLLSTLVADHRQMLLRDPAAVSGKLAKMAEHPFDYLRGSLGQWVRDTTEPGAPGALATTVEVPAAAHMLLLGDPHPENLGTFLPPDGALIVDWNDFDAATWGPWTHDLRRLATALRVFLVGSPLEPGDVDRATEAIVHGYAAGLDGVEVPRGRIVEDLVTRAEAASRAAPEFAGVVDGQPDDDLAPVSETERRAVLQFVGRWPESCLGGCDDGPAKTVLRRLGAGVASYPLMRWYVRLEGPTTADDDDVEIELKEAAPAPVLTTSPALVAWGFSDNAERVVLAQRTLMATPVGDRRLGFAAIDTWSVRVREHTPSQQGLSRARVLARVDDGRWQASDIVALALVLGQRLGAAHARSPLGPDTLTRAGALLRPAVTAAEARLAAETLAFARFMAARVVADHALLVDLLASEGPLLGFTR